MSHVAWRCMAGGLVLNWCMPKQVRSSGFIEPLDASALPLGGLRQDHHGYESMPVSPGGAIPFHAALQPLVNVTSGGVITMLVAPDNSSIVRALPACALCACIVSPYSRDCPPCRSALHGIPERAHRQLPGQISQCSSSMPVQHEPGDVMHHRAAPTRALELRSTSEDHYVLDPDALL